MSADSPRRVGKAGGAVVRPQPVSDKSVVESVVEFFQDVTHAYTHHTGTRQDDKEKVHWVKFEKADINDVNSNPDCNSQSGNAVPLVIVIGYSNGIQIWNVPASGEAQEVLSLRQGPVRSLKLLPNPETGIGRIDAFTGKRPLMALCDASSAGQPYCCVKFVSLRRGDEVHSVSFSHPILSIKANERCVVVSFQDRIAVLDACQFKQMFCIMSCYPVKPSDQNPCALGPRWLAFADKKLVPVHQSGGGMSGDGSQSYAATVISAAKTITKGLTMFGETVASSLTGAKPSPVKKEPSEQEREGSQPGIVTIVDILRINCGQVTVQEDSDGEGLIAHFPAHASERVAAMEFDTSGMLLLTADRLGHNFHVFRIMAHPFSCSLGAVHHLYTLHRGDTTAKVQDIAFTSDSRWVAISSQRGTTHVFPISPYGGGATVRTHTSTRLVNRASRFHRSAGLEDIEHCGSSGRHSPVPQHSASPGSSPGRHDSYRHQVLTQNAINNHMSNPRLPPFPHPATVYPLVQLKQGLSIPGLPATPSATPTATKSKSSTSSVNVAGDFCVASCFARSRGWVAGSPGVTRDKTEEKKAVDSLYIMTWLGALVEYVLDPHAKVTAEKVTEHSPLEVTTTPRAQWNLLRAMTQAELKPPLAPNNPLIVSHDAVVTQRPSSGDLSSGELSRQESRESLSSSHSSREDGEDQWLAQVEILTHAGPHRRLWMGPQFSFKTFQGSQTTTVLASNPSVLLSNSPEPGSHINAMDINEELDLQSLKIQPARSSPMAMPGAKDRRGQQQTSGDHGSAGAGALTIEAGSYEQSPGMMEVPYSSWPESSPAAPSEEVAEEKLRERLADAMIESPIKDSGNLAARHASGNLQKEKEKDGSMSSIEHLSCSSGSGSGVILEGQSVKVVQGHSYDASRASPPASLEHVLFFPSSGSPDSS